jgi:hypothetical protein
MVVFGYVDLTNLWVTGKKVHAPNGDNEDARWRVDPVKLTAALVGDDVVGRLQVFGSRLPARLIETWVGCGWVVRETPVAVDGREVGGMVGLACAALSDAMTDASSGDGSGVRCAVVSGRGDLIPLLRTLRHQRPGMSVESWSGSRFAARGLAAEASTHVALDGLEIGYREDFRPRAAA